MVPRFWLYLLAAALVAELALSGLAQVSAPSTSARGVLALGGLAALVVAMVAGFGVSRAVLKARQEFARRGQVIAAAASISHDWLWEADVAGRFTYCSDGVTELLGYAPDDVVGLLSEELMYDDRGRAAMRQRLVSARTARTGWDHAEGIWRHEDGSAVRLTGAAVALKDHKGRVVGYRGARRTAGDGLTRKALAEKQQRVATVIADRDVEVALQPLVSLVTGEVAGVEALARFGDGRGPDEWFRDAQDGGLVKELDELTFTAALSLFEQLPESVYLSVNAGPELLVDPGFARRLTSSGLPLQRLVVEITEHARVPDYAALKAAVDGLRKHGVRFAIDDTGAGYASLNHVLQLRPDIIKLDRALILDLDGDAARRSLVTALVLLALEIGASVTGEGVETPDQLESLSTLGVDHAQGYLLSRPSTDRHEWPGWWDRRWVGPLAGRDRAGAGTGQSPSRSKGAVV